MGYENVCICNIYQVNYILSPSVPAVLIWNPTLFVLFWQQVLRDTKEKYSITKSPSGSWETNCYLLRENKRRRNKMKVYLNWTT